MLQAWLYGIVKVQQVRLLLSKDMKKFIYIIFAAALFATSCEQKQTVDNGELPIFRGYMQFNTNVSTRSHIATDMKNKNFGVLGYKYSSTSTWDASKTWITPNVFKQDGVEESHIRKVECNANGLCTYDDIVQWEDYKYSFFAYHPYGGNGIDISDGNVTDTPTLTYQYGWLYPTNEDDWYFDGKIYAYDSDAPIFDLMTAEAVDVTGNVDGKVGLDFKHRMFALEVLANNYNENVYEYELDAEGNPKLDDEGRKIVKVDANGKKVIAEGGDAGQNISSLTLKLKGLKYGSMTIPLSINSEDNEKIVYSSAGVTPATEYTFLLSELQLRIPAYNETIEHTFNGNTEVCGEGVATSISKYGSRRGGYLLFIPQEESNEGIQGSLDWIELDYFNAQGKEVSTEFKSTLKFEAGRLYQIYINFVGSGITIDLIEAGNWDVLPEDVTHTFE